ncbi:ABC transporter substrate-binding protein [Atopobium sp. oral taxon 416]|jgi:branched-chain amino acid transport system substrate-binding protein|uniref:ABC transporter substrate-binding protein n=1 Tax=Atopobium sp. oral taxon 416 TaxID=712157 RepID=UPI001BA9CEF1|nr:ABC transporter substrate-binding protein [Atopobium sp. oral taxon 416]QUC04691.1 ABC transporter substrate-binding protein [Atopobium sp. oral taxon 416]
MTSVTRRSFIKASGVSALAVGMASALAACGNGGGSGDSSTISLGVLGPYSGNVAQYGLAVRNGVELYFDQNPQINGKDVHLDEMDEKGDATEAVNAYNKMVENGDVAILGDVTSTPSVAVAQASVNDNMPLVSASATVSNFIDYGKNAFRACITDPYQGKLMADFAADQGYSNIGTIFNSGGDYEKGVNDAFVEEAGNRGLTITTQQGYADGDVDFNSQLTTIIATNPDAIFCPNYYQDDGKIVTQARQQGYTGVFLGADGWSNIVGGDEEYASMEDLEGCYYDCSFVTENTDPKVQQFITDYQNKFNDSPSNFCALGYDAAMVLAHAIDTVEKDGQAQPGTPDYSQAIIDAIASGQVDGVTGSISYAGTGDPVKPTLVITFHNGAQEVFDTIEA